MMPDPIWQLLENGEALVGHPVRFLATTDSTNSVAMALAKEGAPAGTLVVAESQRAGRGRLARHWLSPAGTGLYCSLLLRPGLAFEDLPKITLAAGVALCRAVAATSQLAPQLKWPNDLLLDGKKCGGILTEAELATAGEPPLVVVGIGVNVSTPASAFPESLRDRVTSLAMATDTPPLRGDLLQALLEQLDQVMDRLTAGGFPAILTEWRGYDALIGKELNWLTADGSMVTGVSLGPDAEGLLHIRDRSGKMHQVVSGDISLVSCPPDNS